MTKNQEKGPDNTPSQMTNASEDANVAPSPSKIITVEELEKTTTWRETVEDNTPLQMTSLNCNDPCAGTSLPSQINSITVEELEKTTKKQKTKDNNTPPQIKVAGDEKEEAIAIILKFCFDEEEKENANTVTDIPMTKEKVYHFA